MMAIIVMVSSWVGVARQEELARDEASTPVQNPKCPCFGDDVVENTYGQGFGHSTVTLLARLRGLWLRPAAARP